MSTEELASQAKANGAEAWSTGKYDEAINYFTEAINHGGDKEFLRTLYSNRSAAYLKISNKEKALLDSEKCVSIDGNWSKGYVRKGDALLSLKKYTDAYNAYNSAARISPNDQSIKDKCEQAIRLMSSSSSSNSSSYSNNQSFSGTNGYNPSATVTGNGRIAKIMRYAKLATVVLAVGYVFPMRIVSTLCYRLCAGLIAISTVVGMYQKHGFPKFSMDYAQRVMTDGAAMPLMLTIYAIMSRPYLFILFAMILPEITVFTAHIFHLCQTRLPEVQHQLGPMIARFAPQMANQDLSQLFTNRNMQQFNLMMLQMSSNCEVSQGIILLFELLLPSRNIIQLYMWWQYLKMKYMLEGNSEGNTKKAFKNFDQQILSLVNHRLCPGVIGRGYSFLKTILAKQVELPQPPSSSSNGGAAGGMSSMLSKCTIM